MPPFPDQIISSRSEVGLILVGVADVHTSSHCLCSGSQNQRGSDEVNYLIQTKTEGFEESRVCEPRKR